MAIDVGGTKTLMALFGDDGQIQKRVKFPTPPDYSDFLGQLKVEWQSFGQPTLLAGAAGLPGSIDRELGLLGVVGSRDELASVLAHELSHVTQRHISRLIAQQNRQTPLDRVFEKPTDRPP